MDIQSIRERLLSGFKPKTKDLATPYLEELDGELMLRGVTGRESLDMMEAATEQIIAKDGTVSSKLNGRKLASLRVATCLCARSTGEPVYSVVDVLGENGDGNGALLEMDDTVLQMLISDVHAFIGKKETLAEKKSDSETTLNASPTSSSPLVSDGLSVNSSMESTVPS